MGVQLSDTEIDQAMTRMDTDGSGGVQFEEFKAWWAHHLSKSGKRRLAPLTQVAGQTEATMSLLASMDIFSGTMSKISTYTYIAKCLSHIYVGQAKEQRRGKLAGCWNAGSRGNKETINPCACFLGISK
eukprot:COSAG05_NODE_1795_length_4077_cov_2.741830_3_plen_129_part_00